MKYVIQYGVSPIFKTYSKVILKANPFHLSLKKQCNGYVQYWRERFDAGILWFIVCGSPSEKLEEHFYEFVWKVGLDINFMLHLQMDGPNVNKKFQGLLLESSYLEKTTFLDVGTCPLHIVHSAFRKGVSSLQFNVDQFALDIHFVFKLSAGYRADYEKISVVIDIVAEYALKHCTTRWVTL